MTTTANWRHTFPNRVILHFSDTFSRQSITTLPNFANKDNVSADVGITGNNQQAINWGPPSLGFGTSAIAGLSDANAASNHNQTNKASFDGLWYRSPHSFTWGADYQPPGIPTRFPSRIRAASLCLPGKTRNRCSMGFRWLVRATILPIFCLAFPIRAHWHSATQTNISDPIPMTFM